MKRYLATRHLAAIMLFVSLILYALDYFIVGKGEDVVVSFLGNFAFLPVYVLFVTLMIERVLKERERIALRQKLNMVIGIFFSEVGTELVRNLSGFIVESGELEKRLKVRPQWQVRDFRDADVFIASYEARVDSRMGDLGNLRHFVAGKRDFMLRMLENPNLWSMTSSRIFSGHIPLVDELMSAELRDTLPTDLTTFRRHERAFGHLVREWLIYMRHLKEDYPTCFPWRCGRTPSIPRPMRRYRDGRSVSAGWMCANPRMGGDSQSPRVLWASAR